jgi:hypothetical protein
MVGAFASHSHLDRIPFACDRAPTCTPIMGFREIWRVCALGNQRGVSLLQIGLRLMAAKYAKRGASIVNFSDNNDLLAERSEFEQLIHVFLCQQVT